MAVAELQLQRLALRVGTIADTGDFEHLGEAFGHARDQVLHQRALHTPEGARFTRVVGGLNRNAAFADFIFDVVGKRHRERALRALHRQLAAVDRGRSEEHTSELQSLMRISYAVFCLKKKKNTTTPQTN